MSEPLSNRDIDALVRAHLDRERRAADSDALVRRVLEQIGEPPVAHAPGSPKPRRLAIRSYARWSLATAAAVLFALTGGLYFGLTPASAETLVAEARDRADRPIDRCYRVDVTPAPGSLLERYPALIAAPETRLWARGEQFLVELKMPGKELVWGRDDEGRVWATASPREGVRFDAGEVPEPLAVACEARTLQLRALLDDVLADFRLTRAEGESGLVRLRAEPRPGRQSLRLASAVLDVDPVTKEVQRLTLERTFRGRPLSTVTLTRVEAGPRADDDYRLQGHLAPGAEVFERNHPAARLAALLRLFGPPWKRG